CLWCPLSGFMRYLQCCWSGQPQHVSSAHHSANARKYSHAVRCKDIEAKMTFRQLHRPLFNRSRCAAGRFTPPEGTGYFGNEPCDPFRILREVLWIAHPYHGIADHCEKQPNDYWAETKTRFHNAETSP